MRRSETRSDAAGTLDERAVSDMVAFIMVFGIILTSVAVLSMTGFQTMESYQENEQLHNAERAMDALAENYNDVLRYDGIEERYGELSMQSGTVVTGDGGTELDVSVDDEFIGAKYDEFDHLGDDSFALGEFRYEYADETVAYEGGGIVRAGESGGDSYSVVRERPHLTYDDESGTAIISLVVIDADERSIRSDGSLGFTMSVENRTTVVIDEKADISIELEDSPYEQAWDDVLEDWEDREADRTVITIVEVDVEY